MRFYMEPAHVEIIITRQNGQVEKTILKTELGFRLAEFTAKKESALSQLKGQLVMNFDGEAGSLKPSVQLSI